MPQPFVGAKIQGAPRNYDSDFTPMIQDQRGLDLPQTQTPQEIAESAVIPAAPSLMRFQGVKLTGKLFYAFNGGSGYVFNQTTMSAVVPLIREEIYQYASRSFIDARKAISVEIVAGKLQVKAIGGSLLKFESIQIDGAIIPFL